MALRVDPQASNPAGQRPAQADAGQANALDFKQFAALRRADPNDPRALREVARQFESIFTKMMLEGMRNASFGDPMFGSDQADMYQGMMDDQLAVQLSSGRGLGLADMLFRQLSQGGAGAQLGAGAMTGGATTAFNAATARIAAGSNLPVSADQRQQFLAHIRPHAEAAARELGVDARNIIAQAALETGWGTSQPRDGSGASNNYFGIKAGRGWSGGSVLSDTTEFTDGIAGSERARFRAYGSVAENVEDYVRLLRDNPRYAAALNTGSDVRAFADALQRAGYATDPAYADKIVAVAGQVEQLNNVNSFKSGGNSPISTREPSPPLRTRSNG